MFGDSKRAVAIADGIGIEEAMDFAARAEDEYASHGIDLSGMRYAFNGDKPYGWAIPQSKLEGEHFSEWFEGQHERLYLSDGESIKRGDERYFSGPVTLMTNKPSSYQHGVIHELGHQVFRSRFTMSHKPVPEKVELPIKVLLTLSDGVSEHMCYEEMPDLMDGPNGRIRTKNWRLYEDVLNKEDEFGQTGFQTWKEHFSHNLKTLGPVYRKAVGLNFVLTTWNMGMKMSDYLDMLAEHQPTEEYVLNPMGYRKEVAGIET
jgi:hypothetical protein